MEKNETFTYKYSAKENEEAESIRRKYLPREESKLETLKRLDSRVENAGMIEGLTVGIIGCLIFGIGMCFGLDVFGGADWLSVLFCLMGAVIMAPAYPIYRFISRKTKRELTPKILTISEELINE